MNSLTRNLCEAALLANGGTVEYVRRALLQISKRELRARARTLIRETHPDRRGDVAGRPIQAIALEVAARLTVLGHFETRFRYQEAA